MPQRVSDEDLAHVLDKGRVTEFYMHALLDLRDARQQLADANAAIKKLQAELDRRG